MRCLTLTQPWASLVALGAKKIETRSWATPHRGEVAIHAGKGWTAAERALVEREPFKSALCGLTVETMPHGVVVATAELRAVRIMIDGPPGDPLLLQLDMNAVPEPERTFGGYAEGRYAWMLENVRRLPSPVAALGRLGVFTLPEKAAEAVRVQREDFEERAGILEFQAGLTRAEAERLAFLFMAGPSAPVGGRA